VRGVTGGWRWPLGPIRILIIATALLSVVFLLIPNLDLWFSRQFYDSEIGFPALLIPALHWLRDFSGWLLWAAGIVVGVSLLAKLFVFPRRPALVPGRAMLFLSATLALSAGLLVNGILKSLCGRPRPTEVLEFGGDAPFVTAWHISDFCARNCSFVSGEASAAIWLVAIALVVPRRFRRAALAAAVAFAVAFSLNRIAFGGHFLSDVLLAWTLTLLVIAIAWHFIYVRPPRFFEEAAIDGALTRAGLWIRGLVARRKGGEAAPLHPEAAAVLVADAVAHPPEPHHPARSLRSAGQGFAGSVGPDDGAEPANGTSADDPAWAEDVHRDLDPAAEDIGPRDPASATRAPLPGEPDHDDAVGTQPFDDEHARAAEAAVRDAVEGGLDLGDDGPETAAAPDEPAKDTPSATAPAGATVAENIDSVDPEPEEIVVERAAVTADADTPPVTAAVPAESAATPPEDAPASPAAGADSPAPEASPPEEPPSVAVFPAPADEPAEPPEDAPPRPLLELPPPHRP